MMKHPRIRAFHAAATFLAVFFPWCAGAKEPSVESLEKLFEVSQVQTQALSQIGKVSAAIDGIVNEAVKKQKLTPSQLAELQKKLPEFSKDLQKIILEELGWPKVKVSYAKIYGQTFSQEEVNGLIAFYQSPTGKAFLSKMPQANAQAAQASLDRLPLITQRVQKASSAFLKSFQPAPPKK